ncbi:hypothetical protein VIBRN418_00831 [Vibrio sp. N418]|uniref:hypothetical protein n=1 Tax=Vibrio sp. (strain N418) TaxID=701176 RepID=UPI00021C0A1E|nr:hypothetical protein [Vibrio sp. N418]EGU33628.1 hypothetical protein VIBRN418_00831 [Vibrio sp. N418]
MKSKFFLITRSIYRLLFKSFYFKYKSFVLKRNFHKVLCDINKVFLKEGEVFFPLFGTLLGLYRDNGPIKHDLDIDIGVLSSLDINKVIRMMNEIEFEFKHQLMSIDNPDAFELSFVRNGVSVDFFFCTIIENYHEFPAIRTYDFICEVDESDRFNGNYHTRELILPCDGFSNIVYKGLKLSAPRNLKEHLSYRYGDDFMIPNPKFNYANSSKCLRVVDKNAIIKTKTD